MLVVNILIFITCLLVIRFAVYWIIGQLVLMGWWFPKIMEEEKQKRLAKLDHENALLDKHNGRNTNFFFQERLKNGKH